MLEDHTANLILVFSKYLTLMVFIKNNDKNYLQVPKIERRCKLPNFKKMVSNLFTSNFQQ